MFIFSKTSLVWLAPVCFLLGCLEAGEPEEAYYTVSDFQKVNKIDAHVHLLTGDTSFINQAIADNFRLLTINVDAPSVPPFEEQWKVALQVISAYPQQVAYASTFSVSNWKEKDWQEKTIATIREGVEKGAVAVKIWKNVGMNLRGEDGKLVMIDNPRFDTVLDYMAAHKIPLIGHFGEPKNCWEPLEKMTVNDYKHYYMANPEYHMYLHPGITTYEDQVNARDHMLEKHGDLTFIGAHLGSLEWSIDELAKRLDKFPHMAVDMAERIAHFQLESMNDWQKARDFFVKYQDRLIYATDLIEGSRGSAEMKQHAHDTWLTHWKFFTTDDTMRASSVDGEFKGLKLPRHIIDKIYFANAKKWFPGL